MAVNLIPFSELNLAKARGTTSSNDYNKIAREQYLDILRLYNLANANNKDLKAALRYLMKENHALQRRIEELIVTSSNFNTNKLTAGFWGVENVPETIDLGDGNGIVANGDPGMVQYDYGQLTLPLLDRVSKVHLYDPVTDRYFVPEDIVIDITQSNNDVFLIERNDYNNIIDGKPENLFLARYGSNNQAIKFVDITLTIEFPSSILVNSFMNTIELKGLVGSWALTNILYRDINGNWPSLDGKLDLPDSPDTKPEFNYDEVPSSIPGPLIAANNLAYNCLRFENTEATAVEFNIKIGNYYTENGIKIWDLVIKDIDISYSRYARKGIKYIQFDAPFTVLDQGLKIYREAFGKVNISGIVIGTGPNGSTLPPNIIGLELISDQVTGATPVIKRVVMNSL